MWFALRIKILFVGLVLAACVLGFSAADKMAVVKREPTAATLAVGQSAIYVTPTGEQRVYFNFGNGVNYVLAGDLNVSVAGKQDDADTSSTDATRYWVSTQAIGNKQSVSDTLTKDATRYWVEAAYNKKTSIRYREHYSSLKEAICDGDSIPDGGIIYGQPAKIDTIRPRHFSTWSNVWPFDLNAAGNDQWYETGSAIRIASNTHIILPKDYVIHYQMPDTLNRNYRQLGKVLFLIKDVHDVIIEGGTIISDISNTDSTSWWEADHTIAIWNSQNVTIRDMTIITPGSDGIDITGNSDGPANSNILIENCIIKKNTIRGASGTYFDANFESSPHWTALGNDFTGTNAITALSTAQHAKGSKSLSVTQTGTNGYASSKITFTDSDDYNIRFFVYAAAGHGSGDPVIKIGSSAGASDIQTLTFGGRGYWELQTSKYINSGTHPIIYISFNPSLGDNNAVAYLDAIGGSDKWMIGRHAISVDPHEVDGLTVRDCTLKSDGRGNVDIETYDDGACVKNILFDNVYFGPYDYYDTDGKGLGIQFTLGVNDSLANLKIVNCRFDSMAAGLYVYPNSTAYYGDISVSKSVFSHNDNGVVGGSLINWKFDGNEFIKNARGLFVDGTVKNMNVLNNTFDGNTSGGVGFWDDAGRSYTDVKMIGNTFKNNPCEASNLRRVEGFIYKDNLLQGNTTGFGVSSTSDNGIIENNIASGNTTDMINLSGATNVQYGSNKMAIDGKLVVGSSFAGSDPGALDGVMTSHSIVFPSYRDVLDFTAGAKISAIKRASWNSPPYNSWQSADLAFSTLGDLPGDEDDTKERMRILHSGLIGVGITNPVSALQVSTNTNTVGNPQSYIRIGPQYPEGTNPAAKWDEVGRFGILFQGFRDSQYGGTVGAKIEAQNVAAWNGPFNSVQYTNLIFSTLGTLAGDSDDSSEKMRLTYHGRLAIGNTNPASLLHVGGGVRSDSVITGVLDAPKANVGYTFSINRVGSYDSPDILELNGHASALRNTIIGNKPELLYWYSTGGVAGIIRAGQLKSTGGTIGGLVDSINANTLDGHDTSYYLAKSDTGTSMFNASQLQGVRLNATNPVSGDVLRYNGSRWAPASISAGGGDIEGVTAGTGLSGGGTSGTVTVNAQTTTALWNAASLQGVGISTSAPAVTQVLQYNGNEWAPASISVGGGDIEGVTAGWGVSGGGTSGTVTVAVDTSAGKVATAFDLSGKVGLTGNETVAGVKTFSSTITSGVTAPGNALDAAGNSIVGLRDIEHNESGTGRDFYIINADENRDVYFRINDDGTNRDIMQIDASEAYVRFNNMGIGINAAAEAGYDVTAAAKIKGSIIVSTVANGTAPFYMTSATMCNNLNSNYLNGYQYSDFAAAAHSHAADIEGVTAGTGLSGGGTSGTVTLNAQTTTALWNANSLQGVGISTTAPSLNQVLKYNGSVWAPTAASSGDVVGPASATAGMAALFDGTTGKLLKNSGLFVDGSGQVGLGTTAPACFLTVKPALPTGILVTKEAVPSQVNSCVALEVNAANSGQLSMYASNGHNSSISVNTSDYMTFSNANIYKFQKKGPATLTISGEDAATFTGADSLANLYINNVDGSGSLYLLSGAGMKYGMIAINNSNVLGFSGAGSYSFGAPITITAAAPVNGLDLGGNSIVGLRDIWHDEAANRDFYIVNMDSGKNILMRTKTAAGVSVDNFRLQPDTTVDMGDFGNGHYLEVKKDGTLRLNGNATAWEDTQVPPMNIKVGATAPSFTSGFGGDANLSLYYFAGSVSEDQCWFSVQMPHKWKLGSTVYPHVHWSPTTDVAAGSDTTVWELSYSWASINGTYSTGTTITCKGVGGANAQWDHKIASFAGVSGTGKGLSSVLVCRLRRLSANASDVYTAAAAFLGFDVHFEVDSFGSDTEFVKN